MSRQLIFNVLLIICTLCFSVPSAYSAEKTGRQPVVITSESLTADKQDNSAVFEGSVTAKTGDITMLADKMTVIYDNTGKQIDMIHAVGKVKVYNTEKTIFSNKAVFMNNDEKIIFSGNTKLVEGKNIITGTEITFFIKDSRAIVKGSRMILQNEQEQK